MLNVKKEIGQLIIDAFWDSNPGLRDFKEALIRYWEDTGKKYIMGIDGRKIMTRSKHSLLNALFQSTGAIIMDYACVYMAEKIRAEGLDAARWGFFHDETQWYHSKVEVEEVRFDIDPANPSASKPKEERDGRIWSVPKVLRNGVVLFKSPKEHPNEKKGEIPFEEGDQWVQYYSRVGELAAEAIAAAGKFYKMNLPFGGEYMIGQTWADCH